MFHSRIRQYAAAVLVCLGVLAGLLAPSSASAFEVLGRVVNGTTGKAVAHAKVIAVNPSGGMIAEQQTETIDSLGHFVLDDLKSTAPVYLLRVDYEGVTYTEMVQPSGESTQTHDVTVYEPTTEWEHVHVSVPHMLVTRSADSLKVSKFFQIDNQSDPPRTIAGKGALFRYFVPTDLLGITRFFVQSMSMPLTMQPTPAQEPGYYTADYPLKPGTTNIGVSFALPYANGEYNYEETLAYDVDNMLVATQDPTLEITSDNASFERLGDVQGFSAFSFSSLRKGSVLKIAFRGGDPNAAPPSMGGGSSSAAAGTNPQVFTVPNPTHNASILVTILLGIMLVVFVGIAATQPRSGGIEEQVLLAHKERLLTQLARLDDLHKTGTVSDAVYKLKRSELMNVLAQIYYRTQRPDSEAPAKVANKQGATSV
jgi:hypothetical protein